MNLLYIIVLSLLLLLYAYLASYMFRLEKIGCKCAGGWERDFIQFYFVFLITFILCVVIFNPLPLWIRMIASFINVFGIIVVFLYIRRLKVEKCECSEDTARDVMEIFNYVQIIMFGIAILILILAVMGVIKAPSPKKIKLKSK